MIIKESIKMEIIVEFVRFLHSIKLNEIIIADPRACDRKYFVAASIS